jgi:hypothetical protein
LKKRSAAAGHPGARQKKLDGLMIKIAKARKKLAGFVNLPKAFAWPQLARPANDEPGRLIDRFDMGRRPVRQSRIGPSSKHWRERGDHSLATRP